eukprot:SAG11_NODE_548_length_8594_cov_5.298293_5_plen_30_part_00
MYIDYRYSCIRIYHGTKDVDTFAPPLYYG